MGRSLIIAALVLAFLSACTPTKHDDEYELSYEECKKMRADKNHRFWKQPIAVQGCEMIIFDTEVENSSADH